ncbi:MAG: leucine-rich repeat domain-containing protein, partial [Alistipes sp.]|nr:leucine-rich repeat domain-containing protein [Alistipes sp.]
AFRNCDGLTRVFCERTTPPTALIEYGDWDAFDDNAADRKIYVPAESVDTYKSADGWSKYADAIVADPATLPATNEIWYTSTDGNIVEPHDSSVFGANIVSNTYENGKGVITFDGEVTKIGYNAFRDCDSLTSVTIPDSVTDIRDNPFLDCENLSEFKGKFAADNGRCLIVDGILKSFAPSGLTEYTIPDSVTKIGANAFYWCDGLTSITIPDSVTEIWDNPFLLCFNLTEFKGKFASKDGKCLIEDQGDGGFVVLRAFAGAGLTEYSIPDGVTALDNYVFKGWGFTSITIPDSVTSMGIEVFYCCNNLRSITIPDSVTEIGYKAFMGCSNLRNVTIGNGVTSIDRYAFCGCENLTDISLGSRVKTIEQVAFSMCSSLESITIPDSVTEIGSHTFEYCGNLSEFKGKFAADNGRCLIIDGVLNSFAPAGISTYNIPDGVTQIGEGAFEFCSGLTSITIPDSVTDIGDDAFGYCENLASVFCKRITPPAITISINSFVGKIYVPAESVDAYKEADGWKDFADAIEPYDFSVVSE